MRVNNFSYTYDASWEEVTSAFWRKYCRSYCYVVIPIGHPGQKHSCTYVLNRYIDDEGRLITKRLHVIYQNLPFFMRKMLGNIVTYGGEESIIDPKKKQLIIHSKNLSFTRQAAALDVSSYTVCKDDPTKTEYTKSTTTFAKIAMLMSNQIERWYAYNEGHHFKKSIDVMNDLIFGKVNIDYGLGAGSVTGP